MLSFWTKKKQTQKRIFSRKISSIIKFSTSSLCARAQHGAPDWKTLKKLQFLKRMNFYEFLKNDIFRKLTENRTKRQADTKECVFLNVDQ